MSNPEQGQPEPSEEESTEAQGSTEQVDIDAERVDIDRARHEAAAEDPFHTAARKLDQSIEWQQQQGEDGTTHTRPGTYAGDPNQVYTRKLAEGQLAEAERLRTVRARLKELASEAGTNAGKAALAEIKPRIATTQEAAQAGELSVELDKDYQFIENLNEKQKQPGWPVVGRVAKWLRRVDIHLAQEKIDRGQPIIDRAIGKPAEEVQDQASPDR